MAITGNPLTGYQSNPCKISLESINDYIEQDMYHDDCGLTGTLSD